MQRYYSTNEIGKKAGAVGHRVRYLLETAGVQPSVTVGGTFGYHEAVIDYVAAKQRYVWLESHLAALGRQLAAGRDEDGDPFPADPELAANSKAEHQASIDKAKKSIQHRAKQLHSAEAKLRELGLLSGKGSQE